jgi:hypothetical protein
MSAYYMQFGGSTSSSTSLAAFVSGRPLERGSYYVWLYVLSEGWASFHISICFHQSKTLGGWVVVVRVMFFEEGFLGAARLLSL